MSYQDFERSILSPRLKAVAQHWWQCKGRRPMPAWSDITPSAFHEHLSIVFSYVYDATTDEFFGRLAGNTIASVSGNDFKGVAMKHLRPPDKFPRAFERAKKVVTEAALYRGGGTIYVANGQRFIGERIVLPLSNDGIQVDGIFGAADTHAVPDCYPLSDEEGEKDYWYSIG
jgi:hypothetical protein